MRRVCVRLTEVNGGQSWSLRDRGGLVNGVQ